MTAVAAASEARVRPAVVGHVEEQVGGRLTGWAAAADGTPVVVDVLLDDVRIARTVASLERPDLTAAGLPLGTGFSVRLPPGTDLGAVVVVARPGAGEAWLPVAVGSGPGDTGSRLAVAQALSDEQDGRPQEAVQRWRQLTEEHPRSAEAWCQLARLAVQGPGWREHRAALEVAAALTRDAGAGVRARLVQQACAEGQWDLVLGLTLVTPVDSLQRARAQGHLGLGQHAEAQDLAHAALARRPRDARWRLVQAEACRASGDDGAAEQLLRDLLRDAALPDEALDLLMTVLQSTIGAAAARDEILGGALLGEPAGARGTTALGLLAEAAGQDDVALRHLRRAQPERTGDRAALLALGRASLRTGEPATAATCAAAVLRDRPGHPEAHVLAVDAADAIGDEDAALQTLLRATTVVVRCTPLAVRAVDRLLQRGDTVAARQVAERAVAAAPEDPQAALALVTTRALAGDLVAVLEEAAASPLLSAPERISTLLLRIYDASEDPAIAVLLSSVSAGLWPKAEFHYGLMDVLRRRGEVAGALAWAQTLARTSGEGLQPRQWLTMSALARSADRQSTAASWLAQALPGGGLPALRELATAAVGQDRAAEAVTLLERQRREQPAEAAVRYLLLRALVASGQREQVDRELDALLRELPDHTPALLLTVERAVVRGDRQQALAAAELLGTGATMPAHRPDLLGAALGAHLRDGDLPAARALVSLALDVAERLTGQADGGGPAVRVLLTFASRYGVPQEVLPVLERAASAETEQLHLGRLAAELAHGSGLSETVLPWLDRYDGQDYELLLLKARLLLQVNRSVEAQSLLRWLVDTRTRRIAPLELLIASLEESGQVQEAEAVARRALAVEPRRLRAAQRLAALLRRSGGLDAEVTRLAARVEDFPSDEVARLHLAVHLVEAGQLARADRELSVLVGTRHYDVEVLEAHVSLRYMRMDTAGARGLLASSGLLREPSSRVLRRVGDLYRRLTDATRASRTMRRAVECNPTDVNALLSHAELLLESADPEAAGSVLDDALALDALHPRAYFLLGLLRQHRGDGTGAERALEASLLLRPQDAAVLTQLGLLAEDSGDLERALSLYAASVRTAKALGRQPGTRTLWHTVICSLLLGDQARAVAAHQEQCALLDDVFADHLPVWTGGELDGRSLLILMRGGPGDEVRISTLCFPWLLAQRPSRVSFACDPRLTTLLARTFPEVDLVPTHSGHRRLRRIEKDHDGLIDTAWPGVSRRVVEMAVPFEEVERHDLVGHSDALVHQAWFEGALSRGEVLEPRPLVVDDEERARAAAFLRSLPAGLKVGLCWRGSYASRYRNRGFLDVPDLEELFAVPGAVFVQLQVALTAEEHALLGDRVHARPGLDLFDDFEGTAALLAELDLVISVGVSMRDLAGAVGAETWSITTVPGAPDVWRRTASGRDCWQSTVVHYDLLTYGTTAGVLEALRTDLTRRAAVGLAPAGGP